MRTINVIQFFTGLVNGELARSLTAALIQFCTLAESAQPPLRGNKMRSEAKQQQQQEPLEWEEMFFYTHYSEKALGPICKNYIQ